MAEPAARLLDLDGTLVDSEGFHRQVFRNWFAARGWDIDDDLLASIPGPWTGINVGEAIAELLAQMALLPKPELALGAAELLARPGVRLGLVTSANLAWARTCLGDLLDGFEVVVTRDEVVDGKPYPEPYALACRLLQVSPADCIAVEDAPAGVESALAAGIGQVVGITSTFTAADLTAAHLVVPSLDALHDLL